MKEKNKNSGLRTYLRMKRYLKINQMINLKFKEGSNGISLLLIKIYNISKFYLTIFSKRSKKSI